MNDQNRGLYQKFIVTRTGDSSGKHARCEYFVLDLNHDKHAVAALRAYAESCNEEYPQLAADLRNKARERAFCWENSMRPAAVPLTTEGEKS